ncbi:MAG: hypothetical protein JRG94_22890 [Deltaproteobacteria bacterium]|nr:hypothetical protein [Deltaproteobacteria bacterium]
MRTQCYHTLYFDDGFVESVLTGQRESHREVRHSVVGVEVDGARCGRTGALQRIRFAWIAVLVNLSVHVCQVRPRWGVAWVEFDCAGQAGPHLVVDFTGMDD